MKYWSEFFNFLSKNKEVDAILTKVSPVLVKTPGSHSGIGLITTSTPNKPTIVAIDTTAKQIKIQDDFYTTHPKQFGQIFVNTNKKTTLEGEKKILLNFEEGVDFVKTNQNGLKIFEQTTDNFQKTTGPSIFKDKATLTKIRYEAYIQHLKHYYSILDLNEKALHNKKIQKLLITCALCDSYFIESNKILIQDVNLEQKEIIVSQKANTMLEAITLEFFKNLSDNDKNLIEDLDRLFDNILTKLGPNPFLAEEKLCYTSALQGCKDALLLLEDQ